MSAYLFKRYLYNFEDKAFVQTYGALTEDLRKSSWWPLTFMFAFMLRRVLMVLILCRSDSSNSFYFIILLQLAYLVYLASIRPFYQAEQRREFATEYVLLWIAYFSLLFTGYISSGMTRFNLGYIEMTFLVLFIAYKVLYIFVVSIRSSYFFLKMCYMKYKNP